MGSNCQEKPFTSFNIQSTCTNVQPNPDVLELLKKVPTVDIVDDYCKFTSETGMVVFLVKDKIDPSITEFLSQSKLFSHDLESLLSFNKFKYEYKSSFSHTTYLDGKPILLYFLSVGKACLEETNKAASLGKKIGSVIKQYDIPSVLINTGKVEISIECLVQGFSSELFHGAKQLYTKASLELNEFKISLMNISNNVPKIKDRLSIFCPMFGRVQKMSEILTNLPPNVCSTTFMRNLVAKIADNYNLKFHCLDPDELQSQGYLAGLAVGKGANHPPYLIHLEYTPPDGKFEKTISIIGKGVCFDSGGYNLKTGGSGIETMKMDMGGCASTFSAATMVAQIKPKNVKIHFISYVVENLIDGNAYKPGDIITTADDTTIEVLNTDAEGRLALADSNVYADRLNSDVIVNIATLTGACPHGLSNYIAAMYTKDDSLAKDMTMASSKTGELIWRMPLYEEMMEHLDSKIADVANLATVGKGGSIVAAVFLQKFVKKAKFVHFDIAGPAWDTTATGFGAKMLSEFCLSYGENCHS